MPMLTTETDTKSQDAKVALFGDFPKPKGGYNPAELIKKRIHVLRQRIDKMVERKRQLAIDEKCDRMDKLFEPHQVSLDRDQDTDLLDFDERRILDYSMDDRRKSMPLAYAKISSALAQLIQQNPKVTAEAYKSKYAQLNLMAEKTYEENWGANKTLRQLRYIVFNQALYGLGYGRRYHKVQWRWVHNADGTKKMDYLVNDVVMEKIDVRQVYFDDAANTPRESNDVAYYYDFDLASFRSFFPLEIFPDAIYVRPDADRYVHDDGGMLRMRLRNHRPEEQPKVRVWYYENLTDDTRETMANGVYLEKRPLPGHRLSINGCKWVDPGTSIDGIGLGQIIELYQPLIDDIKNADDERMRQLVRPVRIMGNDVKIAADSDFTVWKSGAELRLEGDINNYKWDRPPSKTPAEVQHELNLKEELDLMLGIPDVLVGLDKSQTAYQAALNREQALKRLALPLAEILDFLEDDANLAFALFREVYSLPLNVQEIVPQDEEYPEAQAIVQLGDPRAVPLENGNIARYRYRQMRLPIAKELLLENGKMIDTGKLVEADERDFWETIPEIFNWEGYLRVQALSFLPVSKALQDQQRKERSQFLIALPITDPMGNPTLKDASGQPFGIDKVKAVKSMIDDGDVDPEDYVFALPQQQQVPGAVPEQGTPAVGPLKMEELTPREAVGMKRPEMESPVGQVATQPAPI